MKSSDEGGQSELGRSEMIWRLFSSGHPWRRYAQIHGLGHDPGAQRAPLRDHRW